MLIGNMVSLFSSAVISIVWGTIFPARYDFQLLLKTGAETNESESRRKLSSRSEVRPTPPRPKATSPGVQTPAQASNLALASP